MNRIKIDQKEIQYPSRYNEIEPKDLPKIAQIIFGIHQKDVRNAKLLRFFLGKKILKQTYTDHIQQLSKTLDWITADRLTKDIINFKVRKNTYIGTGDLLQNITLIEFHHTELFWWIYSKQNRPEYAYKIAAILYRPLNKTAQYQEDKRQAFVVDNIDRDAELLKVSLSPTLIDAILFYYASCTKTIFEDYKDVFEPKEKKSQFKNFRPKQQNTAPNWSKLILDLAQGDMTKLEKVGKMTLLSTLNFLRNEKSKQEN